MLQKIISKCFYPRHNPAWLHAASFPEKQGSGIRAAREPTQSRPRPPSSSPRASLGPDRCPLSTQRLHPSSWRLFQRAHRKGPLRAQPMAWPWLSLAWLSKPPDPRKCKEGIGGWRYLLLEKCQHTRRVTNTFPFAQRYSSGNLATATLADEF